jgi:hypothetical protein|tara:strand:- start:111 stop:293 length:183 start_codon:yes stop_codon:yes gene_type:complete
MPNCKKCNKQVGELIDVCLECVKKMPNPHKLVAQNKAEIVYEPINDETEEVREDELNNKK